VAVKIDPREIKGRWHKGVALDVQTLSSTLIGVNEYGHNIYDTERSELGELVYRVKYKGDASAVPPIVETVVDFLTKPPTFNLIVPAPASTPRTIPPVITIARGIGNALGVPVIECVTPTRATSQLKDVSDPEQRKALIDGLYAVDAAHTQGKIILLFDDLYRSGTTLNAIAGILYEEGGAAEVLALTLTCTRSNK
jgi:competence protein ComFC